MADFKFIEELKSKLRDVTPEDREKLPVFSYSKMDTFKNCPMNYKIKYVDKKRSPASSIALDIGSITHRVLEEKGKLLSSGKEVNYEYLQNMLFNGVTDTDEKTKEEILGTNTLKKKYWEDWSIADNKSNLTYDQKIDIFLKDVLPNRMEDINWKPTYFEHKFEFVFDERVIIMGFIDRVDTYKDHFRVIDYKSSKATYPDSKIKTSPQFYTYALAILNEFGVLPTQFQYDFILINQQQDCMTKGWEKRGYNSLVKLLDKIEESENKKVFKPSPSPLCYWCDFSNGNPKACDGYKTLCDYYSLWTPNDKSFKTNKEWKENVDTSNRKLVF